MAGKLVLARGLGAQALFSREVRVPFVVTNNLPTGIKKWESVYRNPNNMIEEGIWRRTQEECNKAESGWKSPDDRRRRIVHYQHQFGLENSSLLLIEFYLWWHVCLPADDIEAHEEMIFEALRRGGWQRLVSQESEVAFCSGDLFFFLKKMTPDKNSHDRQSGRRFPSDYRILEATFSTGAIKNKRFLSKPWRILNSGIRKKDVRGSPELDCWEMVPEIFPAQVELGCGPSCEAGIPPLHFLHQVYRVTGNDGKFILNPNEDDLVYSVLEDPAGAIMLFSEMYRDCLLAQPASFHQLLRGLYERGLVVGPIITNNFDRLGLKSGLPERYVRRYEESHIIPQIDFHPRAKSLLVVGSHSDRRRIQQAARRKGLRVVYIDPEGFHENGEFRPYLLESPQDGDFLFKAKATEAMEKIAEAVL